MTPIPLYKRTFQNYAYIKSSPQSPTQVVRWSIIILRKQTEVLFTLTSLNPTPSIQTSLIGPIIKVSYVALPGANSTRINAG